MIEFNNLCDETKAILERASRTRGAAPEACVGIFEGNSILLVDAINFLSGLVTNESCGGHPEKLLHPFINFTIVQPEDGCASLAYVINAAQQNGWRVFPKSMMNSSGICYSLLLLPLKAVVHEPNHEFSRELAGTVYFNGAGNSEEVVASQRQVPDLAARILSLARNKKPAGPVPVRKFI